MITIKCNFNGKQADDVGRRIMGSAALLADMSPLWERFVKPVSKAIENNFKIQGNFKGGWKAIDAKYKARKAKEGLSTRILEATGRLKTSASVRGASENICFIDAKRFIWGSSVPYGFYHDSDKPRTKIPWREFMILNPETVNDFITRAIGDFVRASGLPTGVLRKGR